ncbi:MAG: polysaccharide deacetylase family protein [Theionarchaea archaeon]|nr:polysaccharide deacetylase family protein [Theionarchaea archaeon]MBU7037669.1 polysaccharide deacetylase family protein [Theionarchaea archaeon]
MHVCVTADIEKFSDAIAKYGVSCSVNDYHGLRALLDIFCEEDVPSTLFMLGRYVESTPTILDIVRENGHEIASHGYTHLDLRSLSPIALEEELSHCNRLFSARGFRAPYYGFSRLMVKYLEPYFVYDSSQIPVRSASRMDRFLNVYMLSESLMEIPISTVGIVPLTSMVLRMCPLSLAKIMALYTLKRDGYLVVNFHPWEFSFVPPEVPVPFYVTKNAGAAFIKKVKRYLKFLRELNVDFITMEQVYELYR